MNNELKIVYMDINDIHPYEKNPRKNDQAVEYVANSIREFGFKVPLVIDRDNVIVAGHTRYKAAKQLGLTLIPCIMAYDLTLEQIKAFRLADNKTGEAAKWDYGLLEEQLHELELQMDQFGFVMPADDFIENLLNTNFSTATSRNEALDSFQMTFVFKQEHRSSLDEYIRKYGKDPIVQLITTFVGENHA